MELFTKVTIPKSRIQLDYTHKLAFFGSCFADNISAQFASRKFNVLANPFGTVYNPLSIEHSIQNIADGKVFGEQDVFKDERCDGLWHCWDAHSSLSASTRAECIGKLNAANIQAREFLRQADIVFITIGSAFVYTLDGKVVANCHRQDPRIFERRLITVEEAAQAIRGIVDGIRKIKSQKWIASPSARNDVTRLASDTPHIVFTVSPIRHMGDGAHGNNLSKATVLLAIEDILHRHGEAPEATSPLEYFPSYEIVMDELRDYRFYNEDKIHLSKTAEEYIFERMVETYGDSTLRENMAKVEKFLKLASHRIQDDSSPATQELRQKIAAQAKELEMLIPGFSL